MSKLKAGDKVTLRKGLKAGNIYSDCQLTSGMIFNDVKTVEAVTVSGYYVIQNKFFAFSRFMLKKVN